MLGESDKTSFYLDSFCFNAVGIFFVLACTSLFLTLFIMYGQGGGGERSEE